MLMFAYRQIQCRPTPWIYESVETVNEHFEYPQAALAFTSLLIPSAMIESLSAEAGRAAIAFTGLEVAGPITQSETEAGRNSLAFASMLVLLPVTRSAPQETGKVSLAFTSIVV